MLFFALSGSDLLGRRVARAGGFDLAPHEDRDFGGGEHKARPLVAVRGKHVLVLAGLQGGPDQSANDRLIRLLFFIATCREHGAARVTAIAPYLAYSRKDRQTKPHDPVSTRHVAQLFEAAGAEAVVTLDVHNLAAFQNAFRCRTLHLATDRLFAADIAARDRTAPPVVVSPDAGGVKRAQLLREALAAATGRDVGFGFMEKRRSGGRVSGEHFAGEVAGCAVHLVDDMICGGGTLLRAAEAVRTRGAASVDAIVTHGLMTGAAISRLAADPSIDSLTITDSAAPFAVPVTALRNRLRVIGCAPLIADAIRALHDGTDLPEASTPPGIVPIDDRQ